MGASMQITFPGLRGWRTESPSVLVRAGQHAARGAGAWRGATVIITGTVTPSEDLTIDG